MEYGVAGNATLYARYTGNGAPYTGGNAAIYPSIRKDGGSVANLSNNTVLEIDSTKAPGAYTVRYSTTEATARIVDIFACTTTANVTILSPVNIAVLPANISLANISAAGNVAMFGNAANITGNAVVNVPGFVGGVTANVTFANSTINPSAAAIAAAVGANIGSANYAVTLANTAHGGTGATLTLGSQSGPALTVVSAGGNAVLFDGSENGLRCRGDESSVYLDSLWIEDNLTVNSGSIIADIDGTLSGSVGSVAGDVAGNVGGKVIGAGDAAFAGDGAQVDAGNVSVGNVTLAADQPNAIAFAGGVTVAGAFAVAGNISAANISSNLNGNVNGVTGGVGGSVGSVVANVTFANSTVNPSASAIAAAVGANSVITSTSANTAVLAGIANGTANVSANVKLWVGDPPDNLTGGLVPVEAATVRDEAIAGASFATSANAALGAIVAGNVAGNATISGMNANTALLVGIANGTTVVGANVARVDGNVIAACGLRLAGNSYWNNGHFDADVRAIAGCTSASTWALAYFGQYSGGTISYNLAGTVSNVTGTPTANVTAMSQAVGNQVADHVLKRNAANAATSAFGDAIVANNANTLLGTVMMGTTGDTTAAANQVRVSFANGTAMACIPTLSNSTADPLVKVGG